MGRTQPQSIPQFVDAVEAILESLGDGVLVVDETGRFVLFNTAAREIVGDHGGAFDLADFLEHFEVRAADGTPLPIDRLALSRTMSGEPSVEAVQLIRRKADGREIWVRVSSRRLQAPDGRLLGAVSVLRDISQQRQEAALLRLQLEVTHVLADAASVEAGSKGVLEAVCRGLGWTLGALWLGDEEGGTISCVAAWHDQGSPQLAAFVDASQRLAMAAGQGLPGRVWRSGRAEWVADVMRDPGFARKDAARSSGLVAAVVFPLVIGTRPVGVIEFLAGEVRPPDPELLEAMADLGGRFGQFLVSRQTSAARAEAEAKARFFEAVSHELRTPLNSVLGFTQMLEGGAPLTEKQRRYVDNIRSSGEHLLELVNEVLDLSQVQAGHMQVRAEEVYVTEALELAVSRMQPQAEARQLELSWSSSVGLRVHADPRRLGQVLLNLLSNAIKFTPPGGRVDVSAALGEGGVEIAVTDTGIGIARANQQRIFEAFGHTGADSEGTGLGLALSRGLVEAMGGTIRVKSRLGHGSTFTVVLREAAA